MNTIKTALGWLALLACGALGFLAGAGLLDYAGPTQTQIAARLCAFMIALAVFYGTWNTGVSLPRWREERTR